jgi:uncharacterized protein
MKKTIENPRPIAKKAPQRTCLACRQVKNKRDLIRIVRTPDGAVVVDEKGKLAGRGSYLCRAKKCWEEGLKSNRMESVLRLKISPSDRQKLEEYRDQL